MLLIFAELFVGVSAVFGGYALIFTNWMSDFSVLWLVGSPFPDYTGPGLILGFVVGGSNLAAAYSVWKKKALAIEFSMIAGFAMVFFEFFEVYIIHNTHFLQIVYFVIGILTLTLTFVLLRKDKAGSLR